MSYYLVILFFLASCSILGMFKIDKKLEYSLLFISFLALFLFSGLRYDVGMDYSSYEQLYKDSLFQLNPEIKELGWAYLFYWCRNIGISFSIIILLISFFNIYQKIFSVSILIHFDIFLLCTILYIYLQCN